MTTPAQRVTELEAQLVRTVTKLHAQLENFYRSTSDTYQDAIRDLGNAAHSVQITAHEIEFQHMLATRDTPENIGRAALGIKQFFNGQAATGRKNQRKEKQP